METAYIQDMFILGTDIAPKWFKDFIAGDIMQEQSVVGYTLTNDTAAMTGDTVMLLPNDSVAVISYFSSVELIYKDLANSPMLLAGDTVSNNGELYRVLQDTPNTQTLNLDAEKETYRKVKHVELHVKEDFQKDITPYHKGMNCYKGRKYLYEGKTYLCKEDMIPCMFSPDSGIFEWEECR